MGRKNLRLSPWADQPLAFKGLIVVALPLTILLSALVALYVSSRIEQRAEADVRAAFAIQRDIHEVHALLAEAASGVRGYLLSGEDRFLDPYEEAEARLPATLARLDGEIRDPLIRARFERVQGLAQRKREGLSALLAQIRTPPFEQKRLQAALVANKVVLDALRDEIDAMQTRETALLNARLQRADRARAQSFLLTGVCAGLGILGSLGAVYLFSTGIVRRVRILEHNAGQLERGEPLAQLRHDADELGRLGQRMEEASRLLRAREQALRESEERFRLVVEGVRDYGIFALDPEGRVVSWNAGAERIKGWSADEILGRSFETFYPPGTRNHLPEQMLLRARDEGRAEDEGWRLRRDGSSFWANVVITALRDDAGQLRGFSKVTRDMTERKRAEEDLQAAEAAAVSANAAKSAFLSRTSHELQTPLGAILGFAQLLDMDRNMLTEPQRMAIDQIRAAGQHLEALIDDVLDISAIETGHLDLTLEPVNVTNLLTDVTGLAEVDVSSRDIRLAGIEALAAIDVLADRRRLLQVLLNVTTNAIKYNRRGGEVAFDAVVDDRCVTLWVEDEGDGLDPADHDRVFSAFDRLGQERLGSVRGTGLGLALSRQLVEAMGGTIGYQSRRDRRRGTAFWIRLARASAPANGGN